ncbi:hypothetical protein MBLNU13_g00109t1 [Cladosporium sp. NU13]
MTSPTILVAGAVSYDYLVYPMGSQHFFGAEASHVNGDAANIVVRSGGAELVAGLLTAGASDYGLEVIGPVAQSNGVSNGMKSNASTLVDLEPHASSLPGQQPGYHVVRLRHIGQSSSWQAPPTNEAVNTAPIAAVISGSGNDLHDLEPALDLLQRVRPRYIVHHMTRPLATGKLWDAIRDGPKTSGGVPEPDHLVVVVDADDLRAEGINLSQSLSWEATSEDFVRNLGSNGRLDTLVTCPNLIVRFGCEGIIHHRGRDAVNPKLYFNPRSMECETMTHAPEMIGLTSAFTAAFALGFSDATHPNIDRGIRLGISAARDLSTLGFKRNTSDNSPDYPIAEVMSNLKADTRLTTASIPSAKISSGDKWSLFENLTGDPAELARQVVTIGPEKALSRCPARMFGNLLSVDRAEQERLEAVVDIAEERIAAAATTPTCIGVFGPAGSGKTFTATNLADHLGRERPHTKFTFDARSMKEEQFVAACQSIRDASATGSLPVIIFKNFGAVLESESLLLNSFLTLVNSGTFTDQGNERQLGHAVLFFSIDQEAVDSDSAPTPVATEFTLRRRPTTPSAAEWNKMYSDESPLLDSLHGIVNILGPNSTGKDDRMFAIRRAMMLRQIIREKYPHMEVNGIMSFDDAVLHALLLTPKFKQGLNSLEKIISTSRLSHRTRFDVSALPPEEQIQLHVDGRIFMSFLRSPKLPPALRERLAHGLFETYKKQRELMARTDAQRKALESDRSYCDWEDLSGELKESTRAQADDIPRKLRATGCFMLNDGAQEPRGEPFVQIKQFDEKDLLMLSEMEHERFNAERLQRQWRMGPRNGKQRTTPFLVPWRDLTQEWRDVDTVMVECVPGILEGAGWRIYRMQE